MIDRYWLTGSSCSRHQMRTRSFIALSFAVCVAAVAMATMTESRYPTIGKFIWPGSGVTFLIVLLLHANYFGHPLLITGLDIAGVVTKLL